MNSLLITVALLCQSPRENYPMKSQKACALKTIRCLSKKSKKLAITKSLAECLEEEGVK